MCSVHICKHLERCPKKNLSIQVCGCIAHPYTVLHSVELAPLHTHLLLMFILSWVSSLHPVLHTPVNVVFSAGILICGDFSIQEHLQRIYEEPF